MINYPNSQKLPDPSSEISNPNGPLSENWAEENIQSLLEYIEEQGIYLRE